MNDCARVWQHDPTLHAPRAASTEDVPRLLADLCEAINDDRLPPLVQAALVHAQFEAIHPFADGNGRAGRALIQVIFKRRGLAPDYLPPISVVLARGPRYRA